MFAVLGVDVYCAADPAPWVLLTLLSCCVLWLQVEDAWGIHPLVVDNDYDYDYDDGGGGSTGQQRPWGQQRLTDLLLQQARLGRGSYGPSAAPTPGSNGAAAAAAAGVDDGWGGLLGGGGYDDDGLAAEEAAGGWWRDEGDSEEGEEAAAAAAGGEDIAPEGEVPLLQQQQQEQQQEQQDQSVGTDGQPNGSNGSSNGYHEAAEGLGGGGSGVGGDVGGECEVVSRGEECEGECEVGVPEAEDVVGQEVVVVSDSSGVSKRGYGWKPEALPRWSNTH